MKLTSTMSPASTMSLATSATRRIFSTRSSSVKPRSPISPVADIVAVQQDSVSSEAMQSLLQKVCDRGFARPR